MGGINHQPCRTYLAESTRLSRSLSLARSTFELSNVALENIILTELDGNTGSVDECLHNLRRSAGHLNDMKQEIVALRTKMSEMHYEDLPSQDKIDFSLLGARFVAMDIVGSQAWHEIVSIRTQGGFRSVLDEIENKVDDLANRTYNLLASTTGLGLAAESGRVNVVLEENLSGNIRVTFAQLYQGWASFQTFFAASAMASTEIWYVYMGYSSLTGDSPAIHESSKVAQTPAHR